ncbi:F-box protein SKIP23-like [Morus notabilis]|uniref:F-box protein SKIP23-like n=1 Tax=Morus notabilis TaxID=981085 RepID=UPI000CECF828|nr:F-box protein SKIP23-like [Morus notabilis]
MNCVIVVIFSPGLHKLAFIRPTKDPTWNRIHVDHLINFDDVLYYDNRFYAIDNFCRLVSFDTSDPCNLNIKLVVGKTFRTNSSNKLYLVQSYKGEFLRVEREFKYWILTSPEPRWIEINNLGDGALFLGDNSSISVLASHFVGCKANCIYFTHDDGAINLRRSCDMGVYDYEAERYMLHYSMDSAPVSNITAQPPIWVVPALDLF